LSMQFDKDTGKPLRGGKLSFYQANTTTPQLAYKDTGLTLPHPNPLTLDGAGRVPSFYLADGFIRVRLTNARGSVQFDEANLLVIGPSSGDGGGGGSVDANAVLQIGDVLWLDKSGVRAGWVRDNGRTIGSASSGATERANADCQSLYTFLWENFADGICPVLGGRGGSAAADWAADKQIALPDKRGCVAGGLDDMGNSAANRLASTPVVVGGVLVAGAVVGENTHALTSAENGPHTHGITDPGHHHGGSASGNTQGTGAGAAYQGREIGTGDTANATTRITINSSGNGTPHNVVQRTILGTFYRKL